MQFVQPGSLTRALQVLLNDLLGGKTISLSFSSENDIVEVLKMLSEIAQDERVCVQVRLSGRRTVELALSQPSTPAGART